MPAITINDLNNAQLDVGHIAEIATSAAPTATDRLGREKKTLSGLALEFPNAEANAGVAQENAGIAFTQAAVATEAKAAAEAARDAAIIGSGVYVDEPTGRAAVADGAAFKVQGSGEIAAYEYRRINASSSTLIATYPSKAAVTAVKAALDVNGDKLAGFSSVPYVLAHRTYSTDSNTASSIYGWSGGLDWNSATKRVNKIRLGLSLGATAATVNVKVYERSQSVGTAPGDPADVEVASVSVARSSLPAGTAVAVYEFALAEFSFRTGYRYYFTAMVLDSGSAPITAARRNAVTPVASTWVNGFSRNSVGVWNGPSPAGTWYEFEGYDWIATARNNSDYHVIGAPVAAGLVTDLTGCQLQSFDVSTRLSSVTHATATVATNVVHSNYVLKYAAVGASPTIFQIDAAAAVTWLGYSSVDVMEVRRASDNVLLVNGVDYAWAPQGKLVGLVNTADYNVNVTFTGRRERYDAVCYNLTTNALVIRQGTERPVSAHEDLYRGKPAAGDVPLFAAYIVGATISELIPIWEWRGVRRVVNNSEINFLLEQAKKCITKFRAKLARGDGVVISGYGDSNTALGGAGTVTPEFYLPNRLGVDTEAFGGNYYRTEAAEADFNAAYLASVGTVFLNGQVRYRTAPNWRMIDAIERRHGYTFFDGIPGARQVVYLNHGIGGTNHTATVNNGAYPDRLAQVVSPTGYRAPDLVIVAFGMNGGEQSTLVDGMSTIVQTIMNAGSDVIVIGPHWTNTDGVRYALNDWRYVQRRLAEVAAYYGAAYVPIELFQGGAHSGYMGISDKSLTRSNWYNHPGPYERRKFGDLIAELVL